MATGNTTLLGLALPVEGELNGTWGDVVNDSITSLVDSAVAGTTTLSADADVTLTTTVLAANQARQAIIRWTASNGATTRNITAPARSKAYIVINAGTGPIVIRGAGPTTGITIVAGERCLAAWSGSDFVKIATSTTDGVSSVSGTGTVNGITLTGTVTSSGDLTLGGALSGVSLATQVTGTLPVGNGGTGQTSYTDGQLLIGNSTGNTLTKATLTAGTNVTITNAAGAITIAASGGGGSSQWTTSGSNIYYTTGSVGIGTATPTFATGSGLQVKDASFASVRVTGGSNTGLDISQTTSGPAYVYLRDNQPLIFGTNDIERMRVNAGAPILCLSGGSTTATGTGIAFPATQSASSNANTLDDYEEGTWTPSQGAGLTVVGSFTSQGFYTKVGNIVTVTASLFGSTSIASSTTGILCGGLPFTPAPPTAGYVVGSMTNQSGNISNTCFSLNSTNVYGAEATAANSGIHFTMTYRV